MTLREDDKHVIRDRDSLWRRIVNVPQWITSNGDGSWRVSSAAFRDGHTSEVSVHLARLTTSEEALRDRPDDGLVELEAVVPRSIGLIVAFDPTENDQSHSLICAPSGGKINKTQARRMVDAARWLIRPETIRE
jgi:hypothetical protein